MKVPESINRLREICQVSFHEWGDQPWAFMQIRKVSIYLTWALLHFPLTANNITLLGIATGLLASVLFGLNYLIAGVICLQFSILLDFCDGEVSRYRKQQSKEGTYLDKIYHFCVHPSIFAGITIGANQIHPATWIVVVGFISTISVFVDVMTRGYATEIAIWIHCRRLLSKLNAALEVDPKGQSLFRDLLNCDFHNQTSITAMNGRTKHSNLARIFKNIICTWDFPYIFIVLTVVVLIQLFISMVCIGDACFTPLELILLFYAITYPLSIISFLFYNLATRPIGRGYNSFVHDLLLLLNRTSKINIDALVKSDK